MLVYKQFENDSNYMISLQNRMYRQIIFEMFDIARKQFLQAESITCEKSQLGMDITQIKEFVHFPLEWFHDSLAIEYRYTSREEIEQYHMPGVITPLPDDLYFQILWREYFVRRIDELFRDYPQLVRPVLIAVSYQDPDERGIDAEKYIYESLIRILPKCCHRAYEKGFVGY